MRTKTNVLYTSMKEISVQNVCKPLCMKHKMKIAQQINTYKKIYRILKHLINHIIKRTFFCIQ